VADTTSRSRDAIRLIGPSGAVAGMYLNTDVTTGVFKAPAGLQATLPGVVALGRSLTTAELDSMNNNVSPVNAIRVVAGTGPVVMGARTLDQSKSTRYVNIRRTLLYLDRELKSRLEFALFQNNDANLWGRMRTTIDVFLDGFWGAGGLRGATKQQAFYVKIDGENNTASDIANGIVNVEVGIALQYPAEFIKIKLTQQTQL
jgi:phage tail sheath protein FI